MKTEALLKTKRSVSETAFVDMKVWRVPQRVRGSDHDFKYSLALIEGGSCILRYDNEAGKGDHKHFGDSEASYRFRGIDQLQDDFWKDVEEWLDLNTTA